VTLIYQRRLVGSHSPGIFLGKARISPQPHRTAFTCHTPLIFHYMDNRVLSVWVKLRRIGTGQTQHVPGPIDYHHLQAQTQPQVGQEEWDARNGWTMKKR